MNNSLQSICIYNYNGLWVFDDADVGLVKEPFVSGIDDMISHYVKTLHLNADGFNAIFSPTPFPGYTTELQWVRTEMGGNWYHSVELDIDGWLCPALFHYFSEAPDKLFAKFSP